MQRLIDTFIALGIPYTLTDDSEESPGMEDLAETVVEILADSGPVLFCFRRDGSYKDLLAFGRN